MPYDIEKLYESAIREIPAKKLIFVDDVAAIIGVSRTTLYEHFPLGSDKMNTIKDLLSKNKIDLKVSMRKKWYDSENPTLQMGLMKLIATDEERKILSTTYQDITTDGESLNKPIENVTDEELNKRINEIKSKLDGLD